MRSHLSRGPLTPAALALALLLASGCSLFKPRSPQAGGTPTPACLELVATVNIVLNTEAHYGRAGGSTCYASGIDTGFVFHPDPADSSDAVPATPWVNWTRDVETTAETRLGADAESIAVVFDREYANPILSQDTETHYYAYHVLFNPVGPAATVRYQGQADITYQRGAGDNKWRIVAWVDKRDGSGMPTWGILRRAYRSP
jgi:hypothetical protein